MYTFIDNWCGDHYEFPTLREAKKEAKNHTFGFPVTSTKIIKSWRLYHRKKIRYHNH